MIRFRVELHEGCPEQAAPLLRHIEAFARRLEALPEFQAIASPTGYPAGAPDCEATILLARSDAFSEWTCNEDAVGCLAVTSGPFFGERDDESGFNRRLMVAVDLDGSAEAIRDLWLDGHGGRAAAEAWLSTIAHEAVHLADFVKVSGGRTPHDLYMDSENGEWEVHRAATLEDTDWDPCPGGDPDEREEANEERVEETARRLTPMALPPFCDEAFRAMLESGGGPRP